MSFFDFRHVRSLDCDPFLLSVAPRYVSWGDTSKYCCSWEIAVQGWGETMQWKTLWGNLYIIEKILLHSSYFHWVNFEIPELRGTWTPKLLLTLFSPGGVIVPPPDIKSKFSVENSASNIPDTTWLLVFWPNGLNGTKFGRCFFIGLDLRDSFSRSLLGENGYFIVFWHFRPNFKLILHTSKWMLCKQKKCIKWRWLHP